MHGLADLTRPRHVRAVALKTLLLGLAVPSFAHASTTSNTMYALGSYNNARGDRAYTVCSFSVSQRTTVQNGYDDIAMTGAVGCTTWNVGIFGGSTLYDNAGGSFLNRYPVRPVLANGSDFSPNISPNSQTYASYREYSPSRVKYYQARAELDLSSSGGGWQILDPQCTGSYTPRIACNLAVTFPGEYEDLQDGRSKTVAQVEEIRRFAEQQGGQSRDQILSALEDAQQMAGEYVDDLLEADPTTPAAEPSADNATVDDEAAEANGEFIAMEGALGADVAAGRISVPTGLQVAAAMGSPIVHCNAKISRKVGGVMQLAGPDDGVTARRIYWTVSHSCAGPAAIAFRGNPDLRSADNQLLLKYGEPYNDAFGSGPDGRIRLIERNSWLQVGPRTAKRVKWISTVELPSPYQWVNDEPFGNLSGINEGLTTCKRVSSGGYPARLNVLKCDIYSYRFK